MSLTVPTPALHFTLFMCMLVCVCHLEAQVQGALVAHAPASLTVPIPTLHLAILHIPAPLGLRPAIAITPADQVKATKLTRSKQLC